MMPGSIILKKHDVLISQRKYFSNADIERIKDIWKKMYGVKQFEKCKVELLPEKDIREKSPYKKGSVKATYNVNKLHRGTHRRPSNYS